MKSLQLCGNAICKMPVLVFGALTGQVTTVYFPTATSEASEVKTEA